MADIASPRPSALPSWRRLDRVWSAFALILAGLAVAASAEVLPVLRDVASNLAHTSVFILFAVLLIATLRAAAAERVIGAAFQGSELRMVALASLIGGLAPFCSCEVIPFVAALLAMGTPLSAVMAFWLSSPIMDPPMFVITSSGLGLDFALAKTAAAVGIGLLGGAVVMGASRVFGWFADPLRAAVPAGCGACCGSSPEPGERPLMWQFWREAPRRAEFWQSFRDNAMFLFKWLALAYLLEAIMVRYIPAHWIADVLGGSGLKPVVLGALAGAPAYLNGYAAVPLLEGLLAQGLSQGAAMSFVLAGSISCIPAAVAVWALVRPAVFAAYIAIGLCGAMLAGLLWAAVA